MRREKRKRNRKAKRKEKKGKRENRETVLREKKKEEKGEGRKGKRKIFRVSGGRRSKVRGLKLVHAVGSTCGRQKVGVSTNSKR